MKEKLTNNMGIKLLSLPLAVFIWIIIINADDPVSSKTFTNIPVTVQNESYITSSDQVYDVVEGNTVSVTVKAKRSILDKIRPVDLLATADLATVNQFNRVEIEASCPKYDYDITDITAKPKMLTITLEDSITDTKSIQVVTSGNVANGYSLGSVEAIPNMVEITGAESIVKKIAEVRVNVSVSGKAESFTVGDLVPFVYDEDGEQIDSSRLVFSSPSIKVRVNINSNKTIPVIVKVQGKPAYGYNIIKTAYDPETIEVTGTPDALSQVSNIPIIIDAAGSTADIEKNVNLDQYLPDDVKIVGDVTSVAVRITIEKLSFKEFVLNAGDIEVLNVPDDLEFKFTSSQISLRVKLMGAEDELNGITKGNLGAYIDLTGLKAGTHTVDVKIAELEKDVKISGSALRVSITLSKPEKKEPSEETPEPPKETAEPVVTPTPEPPEEDEPEDTTEDEDTE